MTAERSSNLRSRLRARRGFFDRPADLVARGLLGATLTVRSGRRARSVRIVETEAYLRNDPASHAYRGLTKRNRSMFSQPGTLYVYRIHQVVCANLVARRGEAALLRAGATDQPPPSTASGPGRLCRFLGITLDDDGADAVGGSRVGVWLPASRPRAVLVGPRVGIRKAADRALRFAVRGDPAVSRPGSLRSRKPPSRPADAIAES